VSQNTHTRCHSQHSASASLCTCGVLFVLFVHCRNTVSKRVCAVMDNVPSLWVDIRVIHSCTCDMCNACVSVLITGAELITIEKHMQKGWPTSVVVVVVVVVVQRCAALCRTRQECKTASTCFSTLRKEKP